MKRDATRRPKSRFGERSTWTRRIAVASGFLGAVYMATGRADAAVRLYDRPPLRGTSYHAVALASAGRRNEAMEMLKRAEPKAGPFDYGGFARAYAILGDKDRAFQWLTKAFDDAWGVHRNGPTPARCSTCSRATRASMP